MTQREPDAEHDAWLTEALRHAPDAHTDAPSALSATILREARSAAAQPHASAPAPAPRRDRRSRWLVSAWNWLAHPPVAAGFATVLMATLVGVMWWDRPLDETVRRPPAAVSTARRPSAEPESAVVAQAPSEGAAVADSSASPKTSARMTQPAASRQSRAVKTESAPAASPPTRADEPARTSAGAGAAPATAMPAAQPAPAPMREERRTVQASADSKLAKASSAEAGSASLVELRAAVAREPERWRWQRGDGEAQPMTPRLQRWLTELDRASASHWGPASAQAPREGPRALRLLRDGVLQATLSFDADVWLETPGAAVPTSSTATLPQASIDALKKALDDATP